MHDQLHEIIIELKRAQERMHALTRRLPDAQWSQRVAPDKWSVSECVEHLNLFSEMFIPMITRALEEARAMGGGAPTRYRRGIVASMLAWMVGPSTRFMKTKAIPAAVPGADKPAAEVRERFDSLQRELVGLTASAEGLPIDKVFVTSPVDARLRYNLFAALTILAHHQHRHLLQAEQSLPAAAQAV